MLAACSGPPAAGPSRPSASAAGPATPKASAAGPAWLLTRPTLSRLMADPVVRDVLRGSAVYEILQPGQQPLAGIEARLIVTFASAHALERAVSHGTLPAGTYGLLYDAEAWPFTPGAEQRDPVRAAAGAAAAAHAHGLRLVVAPGLSLAAVLAPGSRGPRWRALLDLGLIGRLASAADAVELQAQSLERDTATYAAFVRAAAAQARQASPRVTVLAGLSTNPPGAPVDGAHLTSAIRATRAVVGGYWINVPGRGPRCPACNPPRPDIAVQVLRQLG